MAQTLTSTTDSVEVVRAVLAGETPPEAPPVTEEPAGPPAETTIETPPEPAPEPKPEEPKPEDPKPAAKAKAEEGPGTEAGRALARLRWGQDGQHNAEGRINKLIAERKERDERIAKLEADIARAQEQLRTPPAAPKPAEPAPAATPPPAAEATPAKAKPKQDDFESYDAFTEALADWKVETRLEAERKALREEVEQRFQKQEQAREAERETRLLEERRQRFIESQNAAKARHEDYDEVVRANAGMEIGATAVRYCQDSPLGPEITYFLAKHPDIAEELNHAHPATALVRIGKIEAIIESQLDEHAAEVSGQAPATTVAAAASDVPPRVSISKAPSPAPRVEGGAVVPEKDPSKMTHAEYRAFRQKQQKARAS